MDLDTGLLQRKDESGGAEEAAQRSGRLQEARRDSGEESADEPQSLREAVLIAKRKQEAEETKEGAKKEPTNPIRKSTSRLLRQSWINLIDSWGLTFIWINVHALLHVVIGDKFFCKLGAEWADALPSEAKNNEAAKQGIKTAETVEKMGVGCIDAGCCALIFMILAVVSMIVAFVSGNPLEIIKNIFKALWCYLGGCK